MGSLDFMKPIIRFLPEVGSAKSPPSFGERIMWTAMALMLFFVMYNVVAVGVDPRLAAQSDFLQVVTASRMGSLITTGIGPIVLASIFLQLFVGAKLIEVNMQNSEEKATFYGTQKLLAVILCVLEAAMIVYVGHLQIVGLFPGESVITDAAGKTLINAPMTQLAVMLQIALGSIVLLFMDEVVSKFGIGSGISLFIAAGVALAIIGGVVNLFISDTGVFAAVSSGGAEVIPKALMALAPLFFTILVFLVIVYMEGIKVEIPLAFERARGLGTGFPIKLMYVSNIPVILASALMLNLSLFGGMLADQHFCVGGTLDVNAQTLNKCVGGTDLVAAIGYASASDKRLHDGLLYMISPIYRPVGDYGAYISQMMTATTPMFGIPEWAHILTYIIFMMAICVVFGYFWVETTGMDAASVAKQLDGAGLQIPGFRRDPRIVQSMLEKYIPPIVVIGSAFVGLLASLADLTGALGTGTGILLTVGIVYKMYQDIEKQNVFELNSVASGLLGK